MKKHKALRIIRKIRADYNTISKEWDISRNTPSRRKLLFLRSLKKGQKILDLGCGNGLLIPGVMSKGAVYTGSDISNKLIAIAKKRYKKEVKEKKVRFVIADAVKLPFKNNSFDMAVSFSVLHHIPSEDLRIKFFKEINRVVKPGGMAVVSVWNLLNPWPLERFKIKEQLKHPRPDMDTDDVLMPWKATPGKKPVMRYLHLFRKTELRRLARAAGWKKITIRFQDKSGRLEKNGEDLSMILKKDYARIASK
jgi:tRNA (uracil-5-)-methyltransferase TRM9